MDSSTTEVALLAADPGTKAPRPAEGAEAWANILTLGSLNSWATQTFGSWQSRKRLIKRSKNWNVSLSWNEQPFNCFDSIAKTRLVFLEIKRQQQQQPRCCEFLLLLLFFFEFASVPRSASLRRPAAVDEMSWLGATPFSAHRSVCLSRSSFSLSLSHSLTGSPFSIVLSVWKYFILRKAVPAQCAPNWSLSPSFDSGKKFWPGSQNKKGDACSCFNETPLKWNEM